MDPPNDPLENVLFEGVVIPVVILLLRKNHLLLWSRIWRGLSKTCQRLRIAFACLKLSNFFVPCWDGETPYPMSHAHPGAIACCCFSPLATWRSLLQQTSHRRSFVRMRRSFVAILSKRTAGSEVCFLANGSNSNRLKSVKISFRFKTHRARDMVLSYNMVLVYRNEIYSPGKLMIAVQLWRRGYWKSPHGPWISRNGTSAWNMRQVIWYFPTHFITSPSRMLRNIHPRCIKSPSSNHFPFSQELDESGHKPFTSGRWDQFKANEELFGYVSTYKAGSDPSLEMM